VVVVPVGDSAQKTADEIIRDLHLERQAGIV
jgi:hypothetical protein